MVRNIFDLSGIPVTYCLARITVLLGYTAIAITVIRLLKTDVVKFAKNIYEIW